MFQPDYDKPLIIEDFSFHLTCGACPEQYDVRDKHGSQVAYLRLRHGTYRCDVPDCGGDTLFYAHPQGDGIFVEEEREKYIMATIREIKKYYNDPASYQLEQELVV